ncbi:4Fe-4S dicluster domain-containing protein [Streptomyces sp. DT24]|uniref:ferredoxin family protein n=1 Tax=Streptomyces sp. DT24 TaxID=3416520 RepID=UPI0023B8EF30|nr:ferredoxin family protein [Streptomyces sp. AM 4-1-1]WEH32297.1 ferredoxin family protein [Streptomyces sp. AM 4-1-1]
MVTEQCVRCKFAECVTYCPVACFREAGSFLVIDPEECIDCGNCVEACPADAIYPEDELTPDLAPALGWNARLAPLLPLATSRVVPLADADDWNGKPGKWDSLPVELAPGHPGS